MLVELRVHNLALIARAELELGGGLTVLSGETGAGKTALLSSLKLLVGERGDSALVGASGGETRVEALFASESQEHLVVRRISAEGRSRCYLDDSLVTVGTLAATLGPGVDLYGQHEHQSLLRSQEQLRILDEYAGKPTAEALALYQEQLKAYHEAEQALQRLQELRSSSNAEREQATFLLREIGKVAPEPGEYEALEQQLPRLQHGEQLAFAARGALEQIRGEGGVLERLSQAIRALEVLEGIDVALDEPLLQLKELLIGLEEADTDIGRYVSGLEHDPQALQRTLDRLGELDGLCRRFGPGIAQVFTRKQDAEQLLQSTEHAEEYLAEAACTLNKVKAELEERAAELSELRAAASKRLIALLHKGIADLALASASLAFEVQSLPFERWSNTGSESFELLYAPAPGALPRPLAKIASGGELSRVMLAVKGALQTSEHPMTLVFDEIDAGIGGATAYAVARRLAELSRTHQVIVITHLAQIAARADHHFLVSKVNEGTSTHTTITPLDEQGRVEELARMLSGTLDKEALVHAKKLLKEARS